MEFNPVQYFLDKAKTVPNAKAVFDLLPAVLQEGHTRITKNGVPPCSVIMEHHAVIHPPEFRFEFWNPNRRQLFQCREPILQLESSGGSHVEIDETKDAFREEIFAATFNMIWTDKSEPDALKDNSYQAE
ncbi:hypothetical protein BGZ80_007442, partial [Entomortierella chlamydospora]